LRKWYSCLLLPHTSPLSGPTCFTTILDIFLVGIEEGYPGLVVHGPLTAILLLELVRHNTARPVAGFSFRGQAPLFDLAPFRLVGMPSDGRVELEAQGPDGKTAMNAIAELG
jgi:3-methylfumaryl-CoA hydratase